MLSLPPTDIFHLSRSNSWTAVCQSGTSCCLSHSLIITTYLGVTFDQLSDCLEPYVVSHSKEDDTQPSSSPHNSLTENNNLPRRTSWSAVWQSGTSCCLPTTDTVITTYLGEPVDQLSGNQEPHIVSPSREDDSQPSSSPHLLPTEEIVIIF